MTAFVRSSRCKKTGVRLRRLEEIERAQFSIAPAAIFRNNLSFLNGMKVVIHYARALQLQYGMLHNDTQRKNIVDDTLSADYLPTEIHETYNQYVHVAKLLIRKEDCLSLAEELSSGISGHRRLGTSHFNSLVLYVSEDAMFLFLLEAPLFYARNTAMTALVHDN